MKERGRARAAAGRGQAVGHLPGLAQRGHELAIGQRVGRGEVDWAIDLFMIDQELDGAGEVDFVNPGDELAAVALACRRGRYGPDSSRMAKALPGVRAEDDGGAQGDLARAGRLGRAKNAASQSLATPDGEIPCLGRVPPVRDQLIAAELAGGFVHGAVERVAVDGRRGGVHPESGRIGERGDDAAEQGALCRMRES